ncbi:MAG TPA: DinB family protein [Terriglobales bacterium]|nr:DinB family protein [Terriglobales bacterium]
MKETIRIADQLQRSYAGGAWHGPSLRQVLAGVDARRAAAHPVPHAHSIWELVLHVTTWNRAVLRRVEGRSVRVSAAENFPKVTDTSAAAWKRAQQALADAHRALHRAVRRIPDSRLGRKVPGKPQTVYFMLHGLVQHNIYHAGQMALLKKARRQ